jgi:hypothetical protein
MLVLVLGFTWATLCMAQPHERTQEDARRLIVMINGEAPDAAVFGAGIIIGSSDKRLYILTANHVLRGGAGSQVFDKLRVRLWAPWSASRWVELGGDSVQPLEYDTDLDVAALALELPESLGNYAQQIAVDCLTSSHAVSVRMPVHLIGQAGLVSWNYSTTGNQVAQKPTADLIQVETAVEAASGYSGGGAFTSQWELVGLIQSDAPPELRVLPIHKALAWAARKSYPISLRAYVAIHEFTADPAMVSAGSGTRLTWRASAGGRCRLEPGHGPVEPVGSKLLEELAETTRFSLICESRRAPAPIIRETAVEVLKAPRITLFEQDLRVTDRDGATSVKWAAQNARKCTLDGREVVPSGAASIVVHSSRSISLVCYNGSLVDMRAIVVKPMTHLVLIDSLTITPTRIAPGEDAKLRWDTLNAVQCILMGGGLHRTVASLGEENVRPKRTTTYYLRCTGSGGPAQKSVTINVE